MEASPPARPAVLTRAQASLPGARRAVVIGAGSFGTAIAVLLSRAGVRTTLQTRTEEQAGELAESRVEREVPAGRRAAVAAAHRAGLERRGARRLRLPGGPLDQPRECDRGAPDRVARTPHARSSRSPRGSSRPTGSAPTARFARASAPTASPASAVRPTRRRWSTPAPGWSPRPGTRRSPRASPGSSTAPASSASCPTTRSASSWPASRRTPRRSPPARPRRRGSTPPEPRPATSSPRCGGCAEAAGARPESFIGLAGAGDLVATALAPMSRNRRAGELLAQGVPAAEIQLRVAQAVEALESVPLLAHAIERAGLPAPVTGGLARLIDGELPLADWVALVRATVPPRARWQRSRGFWQRLRERLMRWRRARSRQRRDDRLVDAGAVAGSAAMRTFGCARSASRIVGSRSSALATSQKRADDGGDREVLARVADGEGVLAARGRARACGARPPPPSSRRRGSGGRRAGSPAPAAGWRPARGVSRRRCRPGAGSRGRARASSASASATSTRPRKRWEISRPRCQGSWYSSRPA